MRFRTLILSAAVALAFGISAGEPARAETWLMASGYPESNFLTKNLRAFVEEIEANSDLEIDLQSNDSLIKLDSIKAAIQRGQIPIGEIRLGVYGNEDPMYILGGVPLVAPTYEAAWDLKEAQKPYFDELFAKSGMKVLFYQPWPGQGFYTKTPVDSVEDFEGQKIRIYSTATRDMADMLGFQATILPFAEIPQAFSTGMIEALFTSPQTGIDIQAWDNTSYFTDVGAIFSKNATVVSQRAWDALSPETQEVILTAAANAEKRGWEMSKAANEEQIAVLKEHGMTTQKAPDDLNERLKEIGKTMQDQWRAEASPEAEAVLDKYLDNQ